MGSRNIRSVSHDLESNIQVSCNGPDGSLVEGAGAKKIKQDIYGSPTHGAMPAF